MIGEQEKQKEVKVDDDEVKKLMEEYAGGEEGKAEVKGKKEVKS